MRFLRNKLFTITALTSFLPAASLIALAFIFRLFFHEQFLALFDPDQTSNYGYLLLTAFLIASFLFSTVMSYVVTYNRKTLLNKLKRNMKEIQYGTARSRIVSENYGEFEEIAQIFGEVSDNLNESYVKIGVQASELFNRNIELQRTNDEMEAANQQLKAAMVQLNETEQKYHSLVRNLPEIICVIGLDGRITFINHVCQQMLGYWKRELIGENAGILLGKIIGPAFYARLSERLKSRNSMSSELILKKKDGTEIITDVGITNYVFNNEVQGVQVIARDISVKKKIEAELLKGNKEMALVNNISKTLTSSLEVEDVANLIVREICNVIDFPVCFLGMFNNIDTDTDTDTDNVLKLRALAGKYFEDRTLEQNRFLNTTWKSPAEKKLFENDMPVVINMDSLEDINSDDCIICRINRFVHDEDKIKEILVLPLIGNINKIGIVVVGSKTEFSDREMDMVSLIVNNATIAIDNAILYEKLKLYFIKTIDALIAAVEAKDKYTEGHSQRVSIYAVKIAKRMRFSREEIEDIRIAGILHDIGKIGISDSILTKPGKLTEAEFEIIKQHPVIGNRILNPVGFSEKTIQAITLHHEWYNGKGYPYGLAEDEIAIEAQILSVADAYDAMTVERSYRIAFSEESALEELRRNAGTQFHPEVVEAFLDVYESSGGNLLRNGTDIRKAV